MESFEVQAFDTPLKRPFVTALGRKTSTRNVGLSLRLGGGARGYGEASASLALAHLSPARLAAVLRRLGRAALGSDARRARSLIDRAWREHALESPAAAAFECALLSAWAEAQGLSLASWFGGKLRSVESDITLSAVDALSAASAARSAAREGFRVFKVKVGSGLREDLARAAAAARVHPSAEVILDGNQGLSVRSALRLVEACLKARVAVVLLEQPVPKADLRALAAVTRRSPVPVAADEAVMSPEDAARVAGEGAASVINIKVAKSGLLRSLEIAAAARGAGLGLMIGCMAETARGLSPSVHLALGTGFFRYVDLDSDHLLAAPAGLCGWVRRGPRLSLAQPGA